MKKSKWFIPVAALVILSMILIGCTAKAATETTPATTTEATSAETETTQAEETAPAEEVTLKIMHNWGPEDSKGPAILSIFNDFMKAYPNIKIETEILPDIDIDSKVEVAFQASEEPDIVMQYIGGTNQDWLGDGVTIDVTSLLKEWGLEGIFSDQALKDWTDKDGHLLGFPLEGYAVFNAAYNKKILDAAGVTDIPKTTNDLIAAAEKIKAAGFETFATGGNDWSGFNLATSIITAGVGQDLANQLIGQGRWADNPEAVEAVKLFTSLRDAGVFVSNVEGLDYASANELFYSGKAAILALATWQFGEVPQDMVSDVVMDGFPLPASSPYDKTVVNMGFGGKSLRITRNGAEKLNAVETLTKFFFQPEMIARLVEGGMISPLKETPIDESKLNSLLVEALKANADKFTIISYFDAIMPSKAAADITQTWDAAFIPGTTAEQIITDLDSIISSALEQ